MPRRCTLTLRNYTARSFSASLIDAFFLYGTQQTFVAGLLPDGIIAVLEDVFLVHVLFTSQVANCCSCITEESSKELCPIRIYIMVATLQSKRGTLGTKYCSLDAVNHRHKQVTQRLPTLARNGKTLCAEHHVVAHHCDGCRWMGLWREEDMLSRLVNVSTILSARKLPLADSMAILASRLEIS